MLIASLLFGISASLDALLVGISFGLRGVRIRLWQNLTISLITLLGTCLSVGLGHRLAALLPRAVGAYAGSLILILLGLYYIAKWAAAFLRSCRKAPPRIPPDGRGREKGEGTRRETGPGGACAPAPCLELLEVFGLSLTLSLNNLSAGLSASMAGLALAPTATFTLLCSVLFLAAGNRLGGCHGLQLAGCAAEPVSGALLIGLGLVQLFW